MSQIETDVVIVGAGPTGLALAIECQRHGLRYRIIDKAPARSGLSKALAIWNGTLEAFAAMGVVDDFLSVAMPLRALRLTDRDRTVAHARLDERVDSLYAQPVILPQSETERLLERHLERLGGRVERGVELLAIEPHTDGVECQLMTREGCERHVRASWVAACDGARSTVRKSIGVEYQGYTEATNFVLCDARVEGDLPDDEVYITWSQHGAAAIFPVVKGVWRIVTERRDVADDSPPTLDEMQRALDQRSSGKMRLHDPTWLATFKINERLADRFSVGRVFLLGDAAHIHSPAGGQGMNTGIQDAVNLGWKLAALVRRGEADGALAESYHAERRPVARGVLESSSQRMHMAMADGTLLRVIKDVALAFLGHTRLFQHKLTHELSELNIRYSSGPLMALRAPWPKHAESAGYAAGTRHRDARVFDGDGNVERSLWRETLDTRHTLLFFSGNDGGEAGPQALHTLREAAEAMSADMRLVAVWNGPQRPIHTDGVRWLLDPEGSAHKAYGASEACWYLIRPDQYVALRSMPADVSPLHEYAQAAFANAAATCSSH